MKSKLKNSILKIVQTVFSSDDEKSVPEQKGRAVSLEELVGFTVSSKESGFKGKRITRKLKIKPSTLRTLSKTDPIIRAIINTRKAQISQADWDIIPDTKSLINELNKWKEIEKNNIREYSYKEEFKPLLVGKDYYDLMVPEVSAIISSGKTIPEIDKILDDYFESAIIAINHDIEEKIIKAKNLLSKPTKTGLDKTFRVLMNKVIEDILVGDNGIIIKNYSLDGKEVVELYTVDGFTIEPVLNENGTFDEETAYVQNLGDNKKEIPKFKKEEIIYIMENPMPGQPYGFSATESVIHVIMASLYAEEYNLTFFDQNEITDGILNLGKNVTGEQRRKFKISWDNELKGRAHKFAVINGSEGVQWIPLRGFSAKDMEFMNYLKWTLKVKAACFKINENEIGWTETVNRAVGEVQASISYDNGAISLMKLISEQITEELLKKDICQWIKFEFIAIRKNEDRNKDRVIDRADVDGGILSANDYQRKYGLPVTKGGEEPLVAVQSGKIPLSEIVEYTSGSSNSAQTETIQSNQSENKQESVEENVEDEKSDKITSEEKKELEQIFKAAIGAETTKKKLMSEREKFQNELLSEFKKRGNDIMETIMKRVRVKK